MKKMAIIICLTFINKISFNMKRKNYKKLNFINIDCHDPILSNQFPVLVSKNLVDRKVKRTLINKFLKILLKLTSNKCKQTNKLILNSI